MCLIQYLHTYNKCCSTLEMTAQCIIFGATLAYKNILKCLQTMFVLILQNTVNPECILYFKILCGHWHIKINCWRSLLYNNLILYFVQTYKGDGIFFKQACNRWAWACSNSCCRSLSLRYDDNECGVRRWHWVSFSKW